MSGTLAELWVHDHGAIMTESEIVIRALMHGLVVLGDGEMFPIQIVSPDKRKLELFCRIIDLPFQQIHSRVETHLEGDFLVHYPRWYIQL